MIPPAFRSLRSRHSGGGRSGGGGAGFIARHCSTRSSPSAPVAMKSVTAAAEGRNRNREQQHPAVQSPRASISRRTSDPSIATGFSVSTCFPRANACSASSVRIHAGIASTTASTASSASSASPSR